MCTFRQRNETIAYEVAKRVAASEMGQIVTVHFSRTRIAFSIPLASFLAVLLCLQFFLFLHSLKSKRHNKNLLWQCSVMIVLLRLSVKNCGFFCCCWIRKVNKSSLRYYHMRPLEVSTQKNRQKDNKALLNLQEK